MYVMSTWALISMSLPGFSKMIAGYRSATTLNDGLAYLAEPVPWIGLVLTVLAALMLIEAIRILLTLGSPPTPRLPGSSATTPWPSC